MEVEVILNDRPLTCVSPDERDPEPLTPAHLLYGRRITSLPHPMVEDDELDDPSYGTESDLKKSANTQALILKHFWKRWRLEHLTLLCEFHKTTGNNIQKVQIGDVVLVHDDIPRNRWDLAVIEDVIKGSDGLIRAAKIRTKGGRTNCPIVKLYPLEVRSTECTDRLNSTLSTSNLMVDGDTESQSESRPARRAALKAHQKFSEWAEVLRAPPEDVVD